MTDKEQLWQETVEAFNHYRLLRNKFFQQTTPEERIRIIIPVFGWGSYREITLEVAKTLTPEELKQFCGSLLSISTHINANFETARELLFQIPSDWLAQNVEVYTQPILETADAEQYQMLLGIYRSISQELELNLLQWGTNHNDFEIRTLAQDILAEMDK